MTLNFFLVGRHARFSRPEKDDIGFSLHIKTLYGMLPREERPHQRPRLRMSYFLWSCDGSVPVVNQVWSSLPIIQCIDNVRIELHRWFPKIAGATHLCSFLMDLLYYGFCLSTYFRISDTSWKCITRLPTQQSPPSMVFQLTLSYQRDRIREITHCTQRICIL